MVSKAFNAFSTFYSNDRIMHGIEDRLYTKKYPPFLFGSLISVRFRALFYPVHALIPLHHVNAHYIERCHTVLRQASLDVPFAPLFIFGCANYGNNGARDPLDDIVLSFLTSVVTGSLSSLYQWLRCCTPLYYTIVHYIECDMKTSFALYSDKFPLFHHALCRAF